MAEDEDGTYNKKSSQNTTNERPSQETEKPGLRNEEENVSSERNGETSPVDVKISVSKSTATTRREENPFSFRHFLKRDLSLPGTSSYEHTGARPKVYASTVQHSPTKIDVGYEVRREKSRASDSQTKESNSDCSSNRISDNTSSNSSVEIPLSVVNNSDSKHNLYVDNSDVPFYHRPNMASEPLGMPSLPDFVQDHILVEQVYLNSSVDLDNLPDFTFNTNFNAGPSCRRSVNRNYDYEGATGSIDEGERRVPLDLPAATSLSLDLTESASSAHRRNNSPSNTFPLDLPPNAASFMPVQSPPLAHSSNTFRDYSQPPPQRHSTLQSFLSPTTPRQPLRPVNRNRSFDDKSSTSSRPTAGGGLPDFLPAGGGAPPSPPPPAASPARDLLQQLRAELHATRTELAEERARRQRLELQLRDHTRAHAHDELERLRADNRALQERVSALEVTVRGARAARARGARAAGDLRRAADYADHSLRQLLAGLEQVRTLTRALDADADGDIDTPPPDRT